MSGDESAGSAPTSAGPADRDARLAAVGHELRAPLTSIEGWVEVLLDGALGELSPEQVRRRRGRRPQRQRLRALVAELPSAARHAPRSPPARHRPRLGRRRPPSSGPPSTCCGPPPGSGVWCSTSDPRPGDSTCSATRFASRVRWSTCSATP